MNPEIWSITLHRPRGGKENHDNLTVHVLAAIKRGNPEAWADLKRLVAVAEELADKIAQEDK